MELEAYVGRICIDKDLPCILVAYNGIQFDVPILATCIERAIGSTEATLWWRRLRIGHLFDPLHFLRTRPDDDTRLLRRANGRASLKLGDVYSAVVGTRLLNAHDALADCVAVLTIMRDILFDTALTTLVDQRYCRNLCMHVASCVLLKKKVAHRTLVDMLATKKRKMEEDNKKRDVLQLVSHDNDGITGVK
jgi:DNA polymerase III epsilon subunit-like protein